jgi:two-component system NtrC family sensor kinase
MHYSMLLNRREDIRHIMSTVGNEPGIEVIRIYNKKGEITFSSKAGEIGTTANVSDVACSACHVSGSTLASPQTSELTRIFQSERGYRVMGMITPIKNETTCSEAACHDHPASQTVLGVLDVMVPLKELDESLAELEFVQYRNAFILAATVTVFSGLFILFMVNIPVRQLIRGTDEIRKGNLQHKIAVRTNDEIGTLATSFNQMTDDLRAARDELTQAAQLLEQRVQEKTEELRRAQANMVQMEKMVSLGTLAATVAHELNNPLEGVLTYAKLLRRKLERINLETSVKKELDGELAVIADETARCGNIVKNLLLFSRQKIGEFREANLIDIIEQSLKLISHHLTMNNIQLQTRFEQQPITLYCDPNQLEQAFLAVEINSVEAMPGGGTLQIHVCENKNADSVCIEFVDTGVGIREEDIPHIFEPFFTTKRDGKGTGLGLAVVYGIVKRHGGSVDIQSQLHKGTTVTIQLPRHEIRQEESAFSFSMDKPL